MRNSIIRLLSIVLVIASVIGALSGCGHTHVYLDNHDDLSHWRECVCGDKIEEGIHIGGTATCESPALCVVCSTPWGEKADHQYTSMEYNGQRHWAKCSCGRTTTKEKHEFVNGLCICGYIDPNSVHHHKFTELKFNSTEHWNECACGERDGVEAHSGGTASCTEAAVCEKCCVSYGDKAAHTESIVRITEGEHFYECFCGEVVSSGAHVLADGSCSCGYAPVSGHTHTYNVKKYNAVAHWYECDCGIAEAAMLHEGGEADCDTLATCAECGEEYGSYLHVWNNGELIIKADGENNGSVLYTCEDCGAKKVRFVGSDEVIVTREELEEAIVAAAWAYYMKKTSMQYDSQRLTEISATYGGIVRHSNEVSPEYGTSDTTIYSVCSAYIYCTYLEAIGRRIFEDLYHPNGVLTRHFWAVSDNQPSEGFAEFDSSYLEPRDENDRDMAIVRWMNTDRYYEHTQDVASTGYKLDQFYIEDSTAFGDWYELGEIELVKDGNNYQYYLGGRAVSSSQIKMLLNSWLTKTVDGEYVNLRAGDVIITHGHTLIYIGAGYVLDCDGFKYETADGTDQIEKNGSVYNRIQKVSDILSKANIVFEIIRPLDYYAYDVDGVSGNDIMMYDGEALTVKDSSKSRIEYPAMDIDRTVDITPFGTAAHGETLTYSIKITNNTTHDNYLKWRGEAGYAGEAYLALPVSEVIPTGTAFLSASEGYTLDGDTIYWCIDIPAGESVTLTYTVTVTAEIGEVITSEGGYVADIPSNSISNRVGGAKLTGEQIARLGEIANGGAESLAGYGTDLEFAEAIFAEIGISLELTSVAELVENLFSAEYFETLRAISCFYGEKSTPIVMFTPDGEVKDEYKHLAAMLVDGYYGGRRVFDFDVEYLAKVGYAGVDVTGMNKAITEFRQDYLEVGDILVYATAATRTEAELSYEMASVSVMIYVGNGMLIEMNSDGTARVYTGAETDARLVWAYQENNDIFFLFRPTQAA